MIYCRAYLLIIIDMHENLLAHLSGQLSLLENKLLDLNNKISFLLEEARNEVAGILNESYDEKYEILRKIELIKKQLISLQDNSILTSIKTYRVKVNGDLKSLYVVEHDEMVDPSNGYISKDSNLAGILRSKKIGDSFKLVTPKGDKEYLLVG